MQRVHTSSSDFLLLRGLFGRGHGAVRRGFAGSAFPASCDLNHLTRDSVSSITRHIGGHSGDSPCLLRACMFRVYTLRLAPDLTDHHLLPFAGYRVCPYGLVVLARALLASMSETGVCVIDQVRAEFQARCPSRQVAGTVWWPMCRERILSYIAPPNRDVGTRRDRDRTLQKEGRDFSAAAAFASALPPARLRCPDLTRLG